MLLYLVNGYHNTPKEKKLCKMHFPETETLIYKMKVEKGLKGKKNSMDHAKSDYQTSASFDIWHQVLWHELVGWMLILSSYNLDNLYSKMLNHSVFTPKRKTNKYLTIVEVWSESNANHIGLDTQIFDIYILFVQFGTD